MLAALFVSLDKVLINQLVKVMSNEAYRQAPAWTKLHMLPLPHFKHQSQGVIERKVDESVIILKECRLDIEFCYLLLSVGVAR